MTGLEVWLLAIGLAMDCFAVSIASGIILKRIQWRPMFVMALFFGVFQALMPLLGWTGASTFSHLIESVDHWIAFALLAVLGGKMIKDSFGDEEDAHFDPTKLSSQLLFSVATSIDALAVGISFACLGYKNVSQLTVPLIIIGVCSFVMSVVGNALGIMCGKTVVKRLKPELVGGTILLLIGFRILYEHIGF